jgi:WD40 repeat protein
MTFLKPEFHLQRIYVDGAASEAEIYPVRDLPIDLDMPRRGLFSAGLSVAALLAICRGESVAGQPVGSESDLTNGTVIQAPGPAVSAHSRPVNALAFTPDSKQLLSGSSDRAIKIWSVETYELVDKQPLSGTVRAICTTPSGDFIVASSGLLFSFSPPLVSPFESGRGSFNSVAITSNGRGAVAARLSDRGEIGLWSCSDRTLIDELPGSNERIGALAVAPKGSRLVSGSVEGTLRLWSLSERKEIATFENDAGGKVNALLIIPNGRGLISASEDRDIKLWSLPSGKHVATLSGHDRSVNALALIPESLTLASGSTDASVKLWSLRDKKLLYTLLGHPAPVLSLAISPDGKLLASGDKSGVVILWDLTKLKFETYLFDPAASQKDGITYEVVIEGRTITYTLPCGSPIPPGAKCACNCVPGTYHAPLVIDKPRTERIPRPARTPRRGQSPSFPTGPTFGSGGSMCSCNKICTCIPVCQAHRLLHPDPVVRAMAEQLLLIMGDSESAYMEWAAGRVGGTLRMEIRRVMRSIQGGILPDSSRWPTIAECVARLDHADNVVGIMAAQMLSQPQVAVNWRARSMGIESRIRARLADAVERPWYVRAGFHMPGSPA